MGKLRHLLLLVRSGREGKLLLVVIMGWRTAGQGLTPSTSTFLCGGGGRDSGGGGVGSGTKATQLAMVTSTSTATDPTNSGGAVWGGRRVFIADGGGVGGALVAGTVHA